MTEPPRRIQLSRAKGWRLPPNCSVADIRQHLRGRNVACWCGLADPCHGNVLLEIANG